MKCSTAAVTRVFHPGFETLPGGFYCDGPPIVREGIDVDIDQLAVRLDRDTHVRINSCRFANDLTSFRQEGRKITILRAAVIIAPDGELELVPGEGDGEGMLAFLDLGSGSSTTLRY